jgi:hypothetical protein
VFGLFVFPNTKRENRRPPGNSPESDKSLVLRVISAHKKDRRYPTLLHQKASQNEMQRVVESLLFKEYRLKLTRNGQFTKEMTKRAVGNETVIYSMYRPDRHQNIFHLPVLIFKLLQHGFQPVGFTLNKRHEISYSR